VGELLTLQLAGTDADLPTNHLAFALESGAPTGATLDAATGQLTWTPSADDLGTNTIPVQIVDNGQPALTNSGTIRVVVTPRVAIVLTEIRLVPANSVALTWASEPGRTYQLESRDALGPGGWSPAGQFTATESTTTATNDVAGRTERYYRLQRVP
jgi:hypothetical protein